jgi:parvulin-like peptidyl-prolyl isomerase
MKKSLVLASLVFGSSMALAGTIATVNGQAITDEEVNPLLMQVTQGRFATLPADTQKNIHKKAVEQSIAQKLVVIEARKGKMDKSANFKIELKKAHKRVEEQLLADHWLKKELKKITISNKEAKNYYKKNADQFNEPEKVHARHILVKTKKEAKGIVSALKGKKSKALRTAFIKLAKEKSTGPSGKSGGDLGYFAKGQMVPAFNDVVFKMKVGVISAPVKTQFGYHVIYLEDKKIAKKVAFKLVSNMIKKNLQVEKFKKHLREKMNTLKSKATIKFN